MRIIKSTDAIPVEHPVVLVFGQPGIGKTSLAYSSAQPLLLDFDSGAHRAVNRKDTLVINTWADVAELIQAPKTLEPYQTIVADTVGRCLDVMTADIIASTPKLGPNGNLSQQGWGVLKSRFRQWMGSLRALGKDVLLVAHDREDKDGDTRIVRPDIVGGSYGEVLKTADVVGYLYMAGKDRVLDFNPTDRWIGKNPAGWAPFKVPAVAQATDFVAGLFERSRDALGQISDESAKIAQVVEEWRDQIATFTTAQECNDAKDPINRLAVVIQPQVKKLLLDHAFAQGIQFDRKKKLFQDPAKPDGTPATVTELNW
jgi:hypothetical protein